MSKMERKRKKEKFLRRETFMKKRVLLWIFVVLVLLGVFGVAYYLFFPQILLKGKRNMTLNYLEEYKEPGYTARAFRKDITSKVKVTGKVNSKKLGNYEIHYKVSSGAFSRKTTRHVSVKDIEKPKLSIDKSDVYVCPNTDYVFEEVVATDNYDGDLSEKIEKVLSKDKKIATYRVKDKAGNKKEIHKNIYYEDQESPVITLNGSEVMYAYLGEGFQDPGVSVLDNCDGDLSAQVSVTGGVDTNTLGEYTLSYEIADSSENKASLSRTVIVRERKGIVYLTFDDGPNWGTTDAILDILKEEGVKATFFVTGKGPDELIKREFDEGHTVALHTNCHDYSYVYSSADAYFDDLYTVQNRVERITGQKSMIIRFPGGSSNTVSRKYSVGIMSYLTQEVLNRGFRYYDWNISSGDAGSTTDPNGVYSNVVYSLRNDRENMVLMHDIKTYTRDALRSIIRYGKDNGYVFDKITMDTEMVRQRVGN